MRLQRLEVTFASTHAATRRRTLVAWSEEAVMGPFLWACVALMLFGAAMLLAGVGEPLVWIAVTVVAMASFVIEAGRAQPHARS
jgi:hypothetical protein